MRRLPALFWLLTLATTLAGGLLVIGCSSDNPVVEDPQDPEVTLFMGEFEETSEINGTMKDIAFGLIDSILVAGTTSKSGALVGATYTLTWHASSGYWYATASHEDSVLGIEYDVIDSIQFRHGATVVQWPNEDSLTEVTNYASAVLSGNGIDSAHAEENFTMVREIAGSDTLIANGAGSLSFWYQFEDTTQLGTRSCDAEIIYTTTMTDVLLVEDSLGDTEPIDGTITFSAEVNVLCLGANEISIDGDWTVTQSFNADGTITIVVTNDNGSWTFTDDPDDDVVPWDDDDDDDGDDDQGDSIQPPDSSVVGEQVLNELQIINQISTMTIVASAGFIDSIVKAGLQSGDTSGGSFLSGVELFYSQSQQRWVCTATWSYSEGGDDTTSISVIDTLVFYQGGQRVQYPDPESLDSIASNLTFSASGDGVDTLHLWRAVVLSLLGTESESLVINGEAELEMIYSFVDSGYYFEDEDSSGGDSLPPTLEGAAAIPTSCEVELVYTVTFDGVVMSTAVLDPTGGEESQGDPGCPISGSISSIGEIDMACTGLFELDLSGNWDLLQIFDNGVVTTEVTGPDTSFTVIGECF